MKKNIINLLILFNVLISAIFFVRSYFFPQYYVYTLLPEGKWIYILCGIISVCFSIIYFVVLVGGKERVGNKVYFFVFLYTIMLLIAGFLKNSPYSGYAGLDAVFTRLLYYSMEPPLDFWNFLSSFVPNFARLIFFMCVSVGYCLAAGNIIINHINVEKNSYWNILFSYSYITYIICHRTYLSNNLKIIQIVMGVIYVLLWIIAILKMKKNENIIKKFQIFWLAKLCIVLFVAIAELPELTSNRVMALISDLTIFKAFSWPLFISEQVPYIFRTTIYLCILISINILCLQYMKKKNQ